MTGRRLPGPKRIPGTSISARGSLPVAGCSAHWQLRHVALCRSRCLGPAVSRDYSEEGCARQGETVFRERGYSKDVTSEKGDESGSNDVIANFESHYNVPLNRCFMLLEIFGVGVANAGFQIRSLLDAYEGRIYAEYAWGPAQSKNYSEVRPYCRLMPSDNDQTNCNSEAEFNSFIKNYME